MTISTNTQMAVQTAPGQLYLFNAPTTFVGATLSLKISELFALLYTDGAKKETLNAVSPWAVLNAEGLTTKLKQEPVNFDPADGPAYTIGYQHLSAEMEVTVNDLTAAKLQEILSNTANAKLDITATVTQGAQSITAHGGEVGPNIYTLIYRYPNRQFPGYYDHVLLPFGTFEVDADYKLNKKDVRAMKVKVKANTNSLLTNPDTGRPVYWIEHRTTSVKSA